MLLIKANFCICRYCGKKYISERFLKAHISKTHFLPIDLHRLSLQDAIFFIEEKLEECIDRGIEGVEIIHGYHHGTRLREYIRSEKFTEDMSRVGLNVSLSSIRDLGYTRIKVNMQKLPKGKYTL